MFGSIWYRIRAEYSRRRTGIDTANIEHLRADLRFRLAVTEYAYFGRSGRRIKRPLAELRDLLGDAALHRYLRSLDPELRAQFVERSDGARRRSDSQAPATRARRSGTAQEDFEELLASNVVPIQSATRKTGAPAAQPPDGAPRRDDTRFADSGD